MERLGHPLNAAEAWPPPVHFVPLVGPRYDEGISRGVRLLILGESHYGDATEGEHFGRGCTHYHFQGYLDGCDLAGESQFFQKLPKILTGNVDPTKAESAQAWQRVSYANAVQSLVPAASTSPSRSQFSEAGPALRLMAATLKPDAILMLGRRLWNGIPADVGAWSDEPPIRAEKEDRSVWLVPTGEGYARASWIFHPSRNTESLASAMGVLAELIERCASGPPRPLASRQ